MMKISIAFLAAMSLADFGCHKDKDRDAIAKLTALKDKMCACKDKACSDKVSAELAEWGQEQEKSAGDKPASPSEKEDEKLEAIKEETANCLLKLEVPTGVGAAGSAGAAGTAGGAGGAAGSAGGSAAAGGSADGAATGSAAPAAGSAAGGSAH